MSLKPRISVIIPIHQKNAQLQRTRDFITTSVTPYELILVINDPALRNDIMGVNPQEIVITELQPGRGFALKKGTTIARGDVILFLHSDTQLSTNWGKEIIEKLKDPRIVGGGFSLLFDKTTIFLQNLTKLSIILFHLTGELWGDRAIFVRSSILKKCSSARSVPLFEDIRLSKCMRKHGNIILLEKHVITSANSFRKHGQVRQMIRILLARFCHALGVDPKIIYNSYYNY